MKSVEVERSWTTCSVSGMFTEESEVSRGQWYQVSIKNAHAPEKLYFFQGIFVAAAFRVVRRRPAPTLLHLELPNWNQGLDHVEGRAET
jgi:hypothetical protein